jgi:predicted transcriptional regulator
VIFDDKVRVGLDLERRDLEDLEKIAERWDMSVPAVIRRALEQFLKRHRR